ncbi:hypothetical protein PQX77_001838, partial [Marasmius sp. AFHP31]
GGWDPGISRCNNTGLAEEREEQQMPDSAEAEEFDEDVACSFDVFQGEMAEVFDREDPTLSLLTEEDVAFDMDVFEE